MSLGTRTDKSSVRSVYISGASYSIRHGERQRPGYETAGQATRLRGGLCDCRASYEIAGDSHFLYNSLQLLASALLRVRCPDSRMRAQMPGYAPTRHGVRPDGELLAMAGYVPRKAM